VEFLDQLRHQKFCTTYSVRKYVTTVPFTDYRTFFSLSHTLSLSPLISNQSTRQVFVIKKVHINICPILDGYGVMGVF